MSLSRGFTIRPDARMYTTPAVESPFTLYLGLLALCKTIPDDRDFEPGVSILTVVPFSKGNESFCFALCAFKCCLTFMRSGVFGISRSYDAGKVFLGLRPIKS